MFITAWQRLRIVLLLFSYHTFDFSAKKNFGTLKLPPMKIFCVRHCISVTPATIVSTFAIELQWFCCKFFWSFRRKLAARSLQFNCKCTDDGSRSYRRVCKNVVNIIFFGRYFHYKAIQHFYFACTDRYVGSAMWPECLAKDLWTLAKLAHWARGVKSLL